MSEIPQKQENWESFYHRLRSFAPDDQRRIDFAYHLSKNAHRNQERASGIRYFEHPRSVTLILIDECRIKDPNIIIGALLHDSLEDTAVFGNPTKLPQEDWLRNAKENLSVTFGEEVAEIVIALTNGVGNLEEASEEAILIKMADRLHNLKTLRAMPIEKQEEKVKETVEVYFPLFKKVAGKYRDEAAYLLQEMHKEIVKLSI